MSIDPISEKENLSETIKKKLRSEKSNLTKFWMSRFKEQTGIHYSYLINMIAGRYPMRDDVEKIINDYLNEKG